MTPDQEVFGAPLKDLSYSSRPPASFRSAAVLDPAPESYCLSVPRQPLAVLLLQPVFLLLLLPLAAPQTAVSLRFFVLPVLQMSVRVLAR